MPYCIREVEMDWGIPQVDTVRIDREAHPEDFNIFEDYDAALQFVKTL